MEEYAVKRTNDLPPIAFLLGNLCLCLRRLLYSTAVDAAGLLRTGTPLEWGIYGLSAGALLLFAVAAKKPAAGTAAPAVAALGQLLGGLGIGWTVLRYPAQMYNALGALWKIIGVLAALCLLWTAVCTWRRKRAPFLPQLAPCLFWTVHMLDNYQGWSGEPQLQSYLFDLLGVMAMTLFTYHTAARAAGLSKSRMQTFAALAAGFLCTAAVLPTQPKTQMLYLLCALWALTSLYGSSINEEKGS